MAIRETQTEDDQTELETRGNRRHLIGEGNRIYRLFKLSCGCKVGFRSSPPAIGEVILCQHHGIGVKIVATIKDGREVTTINA